MKHPRTILTEYGFEPKKSLGQNFLFDDGLLKRIVDVAGVKPTDQVLEVGAGLGSLTRVLGGAAETVTSIELDNRLIPILQRELEHFENIEIVHGDILEFDPSAQFSSPYIVVANVPYYITGAIMRHLLSSSPLPTRIVMTIQKELADRLVAAEGNLSLFAVSVRFYGKATKVGEIAAGAFWPKPKVSSSIIRVDIDPDRKQVDEALFFRIAKAGFSQKRKQLKNNFKTLGLSKEQIEGWLETSGFDGTRRAETVKISEWVTLTEAFPLKM